jgi:hypothetical protein
LAGDRTFTYDVREAEEANENPWISPEVDFHKLLCKEGGISACGNGGNCSFDVID